MTRPDGLRAGYDLDENAARFSNLLHVLRELVHLSAGWLPLVPALEHKVRLGDHLHDDARAVAVVRRRLEELRGPSDYPGAPGRELADVLDRAASARAPAAYLTSAYGALKPALLRSVRVQLDRLDPVTDEPSLRLLARLAECQERHLRELPPPAAPAAPGPADLGALRLRMRQVRPLRALPPLGDPARDPFVEVREAGDPALARRPGESEGEGQVPVEPEEQRGFFHARLGAELCAAELTARSAHEHPEMPWGFHVDMARRTWDHVRHARVHEILMRTELGCRWGEHPVGLARFRAIYAQDLLGRLALLDGVTEQTAMWRHSRRRRVLLDRGQERVAAVVDYLLADEAAHARNGLRWGTYLLGGDEAAYRARARELRAGMGDPASRAAS